ncbi:cobalamin binding intrinsic factor-like [Hoplias malabaricus]|uniref:cobalamin binding intrinsic factor-like n=1 Tax=Hoplias malabaricus TaxID=27720 RepID=UPI0034630FE8
MAPQLVSALCSLVLLSTLALGQLVQTEDLKTVPIRVTVKDDFSNVLPSYHTSVLEGGVLYGALRRLQESNSGFKFTVTLDPNFGLFLESVNEVAGSEAKQTYWQILSEHDGMVTELDVGVGCYQPRKDEHIILKYTTWSKE